MLIKIHAIPESDGEWLTLGFLTTLNVVGMVGRMGCHASTPLPCPGWFRGYQEVRSQDKVQGCDTFRKQVDPAAM